VYTRDFTQRMDPDRKARAPLASAQTTDGDGPGTSDAVRTRILRGAARVFGERGYAATSVEAILEAAQVSRRTFYRAFRSKEDVLMTLFERSVRRLLKAVREAARQGTSRYERVVASVEAYVLVHAKAGPLVKVLLLEQFSPGSPLSEQRDRAISIFSAFLARVAVSEGQQAPDPVLVSAVVAGINHVCVQMVAEYPSGNWDVQRAKRAILRILSALQDVA
jgi:AcrR family transcriptional regulator